AGQRKRRGCIQLVAGPPQVRPCRLCRARPCARQSRNELYASAPPETSQKIAIFGVAGGTTRRARCDAAKNAIFATRTNLRTRVLRCREEHGLLHRCATCRRAVLRCREGSRSSAPTSPAPWIQSAPGRTVARRLRFAPGELQ